MCCRGRRGYPLRTAAVDEHDQEHSPQNPAIVLHTMAAYLTPGILAVLPHGIPMSLSLETYSIWQNGLMESPQNISAQLYDPASRNLGSGGF
jgi:hypothetical protein